MTVMDYECVLAAIRQRSISLIMPYHAFHTYKINSRPVRRRQNPVTRKSVTPKLAQPAYT